MAQTDGERIAVLESEVRQLRSEVSDMSEKLDKLLLQAASGRGAFNTVMVLGGLVVGVIGSAVGAIVWLNNNAPAFLK